MGFLEDAAMREGADPTEADRMAAIRLNNCTAIRERGRDGRSLGWVEAALQNTRNALGAE